MVPVESKELQNYSNALGDSLVELQSLTDRANYGLLEPPRHCSCPTNYF